MRINASADVPVHGKELCPRGNLAFDVRPSLAYSAALASSLPRALCARRRGLDSCLRQALIRNQIE